MATRFAVASGNWSNTGIWDSGALPVAGDVIYPNGFTVTIDTDINVASLNNSLPPVYIPGIATPAMTSNTQPSGTVISSNNSGNAFNAFVQYSGLSWNGGSSVAWLGYTFSSAKTIKRYYIRMSSTNNNPKTWTLEGSNDGFLTPGTAVDTVASYTTSANYTSGLINTSNLAFTSYRINVTATQGGSALIINQIEMTESTNGAPVYGQSTGGSFTVPSTLSGIRNITQTGSGILTTNSVTCLTLNHTGANIVNMNTVVGGYIVNPNWGFTSNYSPLIHQNTGILNINGDLYGNQFISTYGAAHTLSVTSGATINIIGNVYSPKQVSASYSSAINVTSTAAGANINITGNLINTSNATVNNNQYNFYATPANVTLNITGNITGDSAYCVYHAGTSGGLVNVIGTVTLVNSSAVPAVVGSASTIFTFSTPIINVGTANPVSVNKIRLNNAYSNSWTFVDQTNASRSLTFGTPSTGPYPAEADVRFGTTYSASPTRTGTLRVPLPQYVSQGVLTDNTVGTAYLSATDVWNVLTSNITTAGSIGERLKNASTVQTNGDQLAAYIV